MTSSLTKRVTVLEQLDLKNAKLQFKNRATGQWLVAKFGNVANPLIASATPSDVPWALYQGTGAAAYNVEIKRMDLPKWNWSAYDGKLDTQKYIAFNHASRVPNTTSPNPPHAWNISQDGSGYFRFHTQGKVLHLLANTKGPADPSSWVRLMPLDLASTAQQWEIWADGVAAPVLTDTSNPANQAALLSKLRQIKFTSNIDTTKGTKAAPLQVKGGFVFCDFADYVGGNDIPALYNALIGKNTSSSILQDFIRTESGGRMNLTLATYSSTAWVRLPKKALDYKDKVEDLLNDLDQKIEVPNDWDILYVAFPKAAPGMNSSQMCAHAFDKTTTNALGQSCSVVYLDPPGYAEADNNTAWVTVHETVHTLGIPDFYNVDLNYRSMGWTLMSDCRVGWHLSGLEKLVLGWDDIQDYYFLESGVLATEIGSQGAADGVKKGIVVMPTTNREECYYMELPQACGRTAADLAGFSRYGLLNWVVSLKGGSNQLSPFVSERCTDTNAYGGASKATFIEGQTFSTNGIRCLSVSKVSATQLSCVVQVDKQVPLKAAATQLRENEGLLFVHPVTGTTLGLKVAMSGLLTGINCRILNSGTPLNLNASVKEKDYGFSLYADKDGSAKWVAGTGPDDPAKEILKTFGPPQSLPQGDYSLKVGYNETAKTSELAVYSGTPGSTGTARTYQVFTLEEGLTPGWSIPEDSNGYRLYFQPEGNICLYKKGVWQWSYSDNKLGFTFISFDNKGSIRFYTGDGLFKTISCTTGTSGSYRLKLTTTASTWKLSVVDAKAGTELYEIR